MYSMSYALRPDDRLISWHIPVRCRSGFDGQLPLPKKLVPDSDAIVAIIQALSNPTCHAVALVGAAGTGKSTALGWLLHTIEQNRMQVHVAVFRCSTRTSLELYEFIQHLPVQNCHQWILVDGLDELRGNRPGSLDELLQPIHPRLLDGTLRLVLSTRPDAALPLLVPPLASQVSTREWDDGWAGIETTEGLRIAILQLQELRYPDVELYASRRGLGMDFVSHLRSLYDLRELVRRFFLLVKLCDLAELLPSGEWKRIRERNQLYKRLLTAWLEVESKRDPGKLPLLADDILVLLEIAAINIDYWAGNNNDSLVAKLGDTLHENRELILQGSDAYVIAEALVNANIVADVGFAHKSMEEFLLARALADCLRTSQMKQLTPERITDDVIGFLAEDESFRSWLDQNQDRLSSISSNYLPHFVRLLHRQGRSVPGLDLKHSNLGCLQLPGVRLKGADLQSASLEGTYLGPADLTGTDLRGTLLHNVSVWWGQNATEIFASADGQDRVWIIYPTANKPLGAAVLVKIGFNEGRIAVYNKYNPCIEHLCSDGQTLYKLPNKLHITNFEITQWMGENIPSERWWLRTDTVALSSISMPGSIWQIGVDQTSLYNNYDELLLSLSHTYGSVRGALGVSRTSDFARCQIDGFCLIGAKLRSICSDKYLQIGNGLPLHQQMQHIVAVGETRIIFKTETGWRTWVPSERESSDLSALANVLRVIALPGGGFALIRHRTVDFVTDDICTVVSQSITVNQHCHIAGIKRERRRAIVLIDRQKIFLIDEKTGQEDLNWLRLRADGARIDKGTLLSNELRAALIGAGAHDESQIRSAPFLGDIMTQKPSSDKTLSKRFSIALSFPGEYRTFVENVASNLAATFTKDRLLYDKYLEAEFARLDLDTYLPNLYRNESELVVIFLCQEYKNKHWCNLEWRFIKQLIATIDQDRIMLLSFGEPGDLTGIGILPGDGYINIDSRQPDEIIELILQRHDINLKRTSDKHNLPDE
jgi:hypothetical protein